MGCFNLSGFYSHAPIEYGDRVGAIVCIVEPITGTNDLCRPIGATGFGYHPIMAPIYGTYDDYGGIENPDESVSLKTFNEVIGIDFLLFQEMNYRNGGTSLSTEDNHNQFDNIPEYQTYLKKIIPGFTPYETCVDNSEEVNDSIVKLNLWLTEKKEKAVVHIIYEHEDVLKELEKIGNKSATEMFKHYKEEVKNYVDRENEILNLIYKELIYKASNEDNKNELLRITDESINNHLKSTFEKYLSLGNCCDSDFDMSILVYDHNYKNVDIPEYKKEIIKILAISHALNRCGGYYCASKYDSQESYIKEKCKINRVISRILNK